MTHFRVIPRDLFNEAKLLKSLGQLCLKIHEGQADPLTVDHEDPEAGFTVELSPTHGTLFVRDLWFYCNGLPVEFYTDYNDRDPYPLWAEFTFGSADPANPIPENQRGPFQVFDDSGEFSEGFRAGVLEVQPCV